MTKPVADFKGMVTSTQYRLAEIRGFVSEQGKKLSQG